MAIQSIGFDGGVVTSTAARDPMTNRHRSAVAAALVIAAACLLAGCTRDFDRVLTFSGSVVGRESAVIRRQLERFERANPSIRVALRATPDAADQRHESLVPGALPDDAERDARHRHRVVPAETRIAIDDRTAFRLRCDRLHIFDGPTGRCLPETCR